ncbi:MAG: cytidylyltransferase domain-containing protein, partial [Bdellovibrionales bacterium]
MAIIPARLESQRLFKKPLQLIQGKPLIVHVAEEVQKTGVFEQVYIATDSNEVMDLFKEHSAKAIMTSVDHQSGTDRINEAASKIEEDFDTIFNIQGDEPFVYGEDLKFLKSSLEEGFKMSSLYEEIKSSDVSDPNKVKVILDNNK